MQKIRCGSAIKVNFIALALHYLCHKKKLKPFGKMKTFLWIAAFVLSILSGKFLLFVSCVIVIYIMKYFAKKENISEEDGEYYLWKSGLGPKPKKRR